MRKGPVPMHTPLKSPFSSRQLGLYMALPKFTMLYSWVGAGWEKVRRTV